MPAYEQELEAAMQAVRCAASVCQSVQKTLAASSTIVKGDTSPVTIADFASQAVVCAKLQQMVPDIPVVAEEGTQELRQPGNADLRQQVIRLVSSGLKRICSEAQVLEWIDLGHADPTQRRWYWTLDPVDGTKGFLRREQYAIALALIEEGHIQAAVLACPNLDGAGPSGLMLTAVRGQGARCLPLTNGPAPQRLRVSPQASPACARFCESVESGHSDQSTAAKVAKRLSIRQPPLRMDSQAKYAAVARGDAEIYLRLPTGADYRENIWDHAAGVLIVQEAGGRVTDAHGAELKFTTGRRLEDNRGIVATNGKIHEAVLSAVRATLQSE